MRVNVGIALLATMIFAFTALFKVNYLDYAAPVPYSKFNAITFYDFKGFKKPAESLYGIKEFAYIGLSRNVKLGSGNTLQAITYFHPSRSYVFNQHLRDRGLLSHEIYHLHIAEYVTRLIRRDIFEYNGKVSASVIKVINAKYDQLENEMQLKYDDETYHSYVLDAQKSWEHIIDSSLASLAKFRDEAMRLKNLSE